VQTVEEKQEPRLYRLLSEFEVCTGVPVLINTSFNGREQPIVETPEDAISAFVSLRLDALVIGNYIVRMRDI
jgi:carbamoyltransferase